MLGSNQDRANCFTHKKALFIVDQNSVGFIGSPISLDEIDWNFKKTSQNLDKSLGITVASKYFVYILIHTVFQVYFGTIHLRRRQIFTIIDPYPPTIGIPAKCL